MEQLILAASECDAENEIICVPESVNELFELPFLGFWNRTMTLAGPRRDHRDRACSTSGSSATRTGWSRASSAPSSRCSFGSCATRSPSASSARSTGCKYFPWLLSLFLFILVGNLFEISPFINFPVTSRMWAVPALLAILTWIIFVVSGFKEQGFGYLKDTLFPPGVPEALYLLVAPIEFVSTFLVRPFSLAVRLFANLVAGHVMLTLLLVSGWVFITGAGGLAKIPIGIGWFALGLGIYMFEIIVAILQAYIFTLLSAVYVQTSVHPEH